MPRTPADALGSSSAVFQGRVIAIEQPDQREINYSVRLVVDTVWKGAALAEIVVTSRQHDAICGYPFVLGQAYLVYAAEEREQLAVGLCSGTRLTSEAQADLSVLGPGTPVVTDLGAGPSYPGEE
jgi:hypothetical protein